MQVIKARTRKGETMNREMINQENEIAMEIEELESKIAPDSSSSSFLD
jgi:hypothetical protein